MLQRFAKVRNLVTPARTFAKHVPYMEPEWENKINKLSLDEYLKDMMNTRHANAAGYIDLPKSNFKKMVVRTQTAEDVEVLKEAHVNYLGHRNILPQVMLDQMMM